MHSSHLIEKLKFGDKYILANIVVMPICKTSENDGLTEQELAARNKYLTRDIWQSFVYYKLYDLFRKHLPVEGTHHDKDSPYQMNQEYRLHCTERPYLQMKYEFRDKQFRNNLNIIFKEKHAILHDSCIYVEISDQGRLIFDKVDDRDKTVLRLLKEIDELKSASADGVRTSTSPPPGRTASKRAATEYEEYSPEPVKKCSVEEYVPSTRNGLSPGTKRTYKPSKIVDTVKAATLSEPDPYTPGTVDKPLKVSYIPSASPLNTLGKSSKSHSKSSTTKVAAVERNLFGSDDDEYIPIEPNVPTTETVQARTQLTLSGDKDMFADQEQDSPKRAEDKTSERDPSDTGDLAHLQVAKRELLPRNSKLNSRALRPDSPEEKRKSKMVKKCVASRSDDNVGKHQLRLKHGIRKKAEQRKENSLRSQNKLEQISKIAKQLSKVEVLDCSNLSKEEIIESFERFRLELQEIFFRYKDCTERQWKNSSELCYFTDLANVMDDEQKLVMLHHLEETFVSEEDRGKYTEFFTSSLLMEWVLRIFMERHNFGNRQEALDRIKQQETSYLASLPNDFLLKYQ